MSKLKSRKFWMAVVSGLLVVTNQGLGLELPDDTILAFAGIVLGYMVSQGWVDGLEIKAQAGQTNIGGTDTSLRGQ